VPIASIATRAAPRLRTINERAAVVLDRHRAHRGAAGRARVPIRRALEPMSAGS
jgi:hypothetical protein